MKDELIVILTALDLEYLAVREHLEELTDRTHDADTIFEVGRVRGSRTRVALALVGKGNHHAAVLAERAAETFRPTAMIFTGVAGALRSSVALGDVVVATHVYGYHGGTSQDDGLKSRPRSWETAHGADQLARRVARVGAWSDSLTARGKSPVVHFGPIAAGEIVLDSATSSEARWLREHYNDALAVEMEAAGIAQAAHLNKSLPMVVVRGASDRADGTKTRTDGKRWQPKAAANAAAFAIALARELADARTTRISKVNIEAKETAMVGSRQNIARDNARVGVQAGQINGGVRIAPEREAERPVGLPGQVAGLRIALAEARRAGTLDEDTCAAAEEELAKVDAALDPAAGAAGRGLLLALKRLRGLIADLAEPAALVTAAIVTAQGMS
ncbi:5'-methylthioadenosine/S-adenosylhomocysteine nucleosidase [Phytomonospora sp. NPDC050363]|uniref:5'-methylthioadenosine/S-adenosylhomocysteine nucleosidase n=1 Tax=Phytomonospora sp. NPDC050363 TaxID=3155642 RepID=UPI0033F158D6